jgi:tryptophanyl-tRNA synthetase
VGADQIQHLELARDIGERVNRQLGKPLFTLPRPILRKYDFRLEMLHVELTNRHISGTHSSSYVIARY